MKVQINIARNIGGKPMSEDSWSNFRSDVRIAIFRAMRRDSDGRGTFPDILASGIYNCDIWDEESYFILAHVSYGFNKVQFLSEIQMLTQRYDQDSIAVTHMCDDDNFLIERIKL